MFYKNGDFVQSVESVEIGELVGDLFHSCSRFTLKD